MASSETDTPRAPAGCFLTTHWSVVLAAGHSDTPRAQAALEKLCRAYWFPLYAYVRRRGHSVEDAQDLTQEFFARVLEHRWLARADQAKGRFRTFLLTAMERFLANEWDKVRALKRGGGESPLSLDAILAEEEGQPADAATPHNISTIAMTPNTMDDTGEEPLDGGD